MRNLTDPPDGGDPPAQPSAAETESVVGPGGVFQEAFYFSGPPDTPGHATGGGMIAGAGGESNVTFGFNAMSNGVTFKGNCVVADHALGPRVKCLDVTSYVQDANHSTFRGNAEVNGTPTGYRVDVTDNGSPERATRS